MVLALSLYKLDVISRKKTAHTLYKKGKYIKSKKDKLKMLIFDTSEMLQL